MLMHRSRLHELTQAVFSVEQPEVYEAYSAYEHESCGGRVEKERIELRPEKCTGHTYRYSIGGWAIFHLQCDFRNNPAVEARVAVNSHERAITWEPHYPEWLGAEKWNWSAVETHERRLLRKLRSLA